ncbi:TRM11 family SAM-dependent methyltransferase [Ureibacillus xyleni]|uniref:TRM11 family SAM-dependent methyltransferase n=1 Tax=Ureibacillus xyleni TaxID=614648 RepID=UPI001141BFAF|nr:RNA methyltransferase [Ureibacillus xyleni]
MSNEQKHCTYIYTYVHHEDEHDLCRMEMRSFFGFDSQSNYLISDVKVDPSRSPFIEGRLEVLFDSNNLQEISNYAKNVQVSSTFKVINLNQFEIGNTKKIPHPERRKIEREVGLNIIGEPELDHPNQIFGILLLGERWYFGLYEKSESVWRQHVHKPKSYSTALSTRVARAVANIAAPKPENLRVIDPCCGIGTVVVEALSMGINIVGRDISPLVCVGARENIAYFGIHGDITKGPISEVTEHYDVAIVDLPYNIYSHITDDEQLDLIKNARRIADRVVFVTVEPIDEFVHAAGFIIKDRCIARKAQFERQILLCE